MPLILMADAAIGSQSMQITQMEGMLMRWYGQWSVTVLASAGFVAGRAGAQAVGFSASAAT